MKRRWKILLGVLAVIVASGAALAVYHRENLKALYYYTSYQAAEIDGKLEDNDRAITDAIQKITDQPVRQMTEEEQALLAAGELTLDDVIALMLNPENNKEQMGTEPGGAPQDTADEDGSDAGNDVLAGLVAEAYALRAYFTSSLESLKSQATAEYNALPEESRTAVAKGEIGLKYISLGGSLENECDALMEDLISRIEAELALNGGDSSVTSEIRGLYAEEKVLRKAQYMSLYN